MKKNKVQIVYALANKQQIITAIVEDGCTAINAVIQSGILDQCPELRLETLKLGNYSKIIAHNTIVQEGMRVEIYRPLIADPKEIRRQRAVLAKKVHQ